MANTCTSTIIFNCDDDETYDTLLGFIEKIQDETFLKEILDVNNGDRVIPSWLGNIMVGLYGKEYKDKIGEYNDLHLRGDIESYEGDVNDKSIRVFTETAWSPMLKCWDIALNELGIRDKVKWCASSSESGFEIYEIYDPDGCGNFDEETVEVDYWLEDDEFLYLPENKIISDLIEKKYLSTEELKESLSEFFSDKHSSVETLAERFNNMEFDFKDDDDGSYIYVHIYTYVNDIY